MINGKYILGGIGDAKYVVRGSIKSMRNRRLVCYHCCTAMEPSEGTMVVGLITVEEAPVWDCPQCNRKMLLIRNAVDTDGMWYQRALNNVLKHGTIMNYETFMRILLSNENTEGN